MTYETGWSDAQITILLALVKYRQDLIAAVAKREWPTQEVRAKIIETVENVMDGATEIVVNLKGGKDAE